MYAGYIHNWRHMHLQCCELGENNSWKLVLSFHHRIWGSNSVFRLPQQVLLVLNHFARPFLFEFFSNTFTANTANKNLIDHTYFIQSHTYYYAVLREWHQTQDLCILGQCFTIKLQPWHCCCDSQPYLCLPWIHPPKTCVVNLIPRITMWGSRT